LDVLVQSDRKTKGFCALEAIGKGGICPENLPAVRLLVETTCGQLGGHLGRKLAATVYRAVPHARGFHTNTSGLSTPSGAVLRKPSPYRVPMWWPNSWARALM